MPQTINNMVQEWANSSTTFTALKMNVQGPGGGAEQSAAASLLMDLQVGGNSKVNFRKDGSLSLNVGGGNPILIRSVDAYGTAEIAGVSGGIRFKPSGSTNSAAISWSGNFLARSAGAFSFLPGEDYTAAIGDTILTRRAAANLRLGAADAAGSAIAINSVASNQITLASAHGLSNGAAVQVTFTAGGAAPFGTAINTTYYARSINATTIELYTGFEQAITTSSTTGLVVVANAGTNAFVNRSGPFQTLSVQSFTGTDIPGQPFVITGSQGTGTGRGGEIIFQIAPSGSTGSVQNALITGAVISAIPGGARLSLARDGGSSYIEALASGVNGININNRIILGGANSYSTYLASDCSFGWSAGSAVATGVSDLRLWRDAGDTLALRRDANPQRLNIYGTYTAANNFERLFAEYNAAGTAFRIGTEKGASGGTARALEFQTDGVTRLTITSGGLSAFSAQISAPGINSTSFVVAANNNRYTWAAADISMYRDAANAIGIRDSSAPTNPQALHIYNTYTSDTVYERGFARWFGNEFRIGTESTGAGTSVRAIGLYSGGVRYMYIGSNFVQADFDLYTLGNVIMAAKYTEIAEMTAPAAPAANKVRIYAEDNGSGKTRLMARFGSGDPVQIAIEP